MAKQKEILVVYSYRASFVAKDIAILAKRYKVTEYKFNLDNKWLLPWEFTKQFFFLLFNIRRFNYINSQLVGYYTVLPTVLGSLFKVKSILLVGGSECFSFPSIGYGNLRKTFLRWATHISYKYCDLIMPVHESLVLQDLTYYPVDYPKQGINYFFPDIIKPVISVYNGYDIDKWKPTGDARVPNSFITVALGLDKHRTYLRKGVDLIEAAARRFPEYSFTIIGVPKNSAIGKGLPNVTVYEKVPNAELPGMLSKVEFYFQLSIAEGFPNALCEAMACGCIPIVSAVSAMPYIVADAGFVLPVKDEERLFGIIAQATAADKAALAIKARQRIVENYTEQAREEAMFAAIETI